MEVKLFQFTDEQKAIKDTLRKFAEKELKPLALELDQMHEGYINWELCKKASDMGIFSGWLPKKYGGCFGGISGCIAMEELGAVEPGFALFTSLTGMGIGCIAFSGDKTLMDRFYPRIIEAEKTGRPEIWSIAITEPEAGSDVEHFEGAKGARLRTFARKKGDKYIINGRKCFISAGNVAKIVFVFAAMDKKEGIHSWTCFAVPTDSQGFSVGKIEDKIGQRSSPITELVFEDVEIPEENRIGPEKGGWVILQNLLASSRRTVGALSVGIARGAFEKSLKYATERYQGNKQIIEHQMVQKMLADMAIKIDSARLLCYNAASARPASPKLSSMAKVYATDIAVEVCSDAIQIMGGYGLIKEYGVEKLYRDARINQIMEGTNQVCRIAIVEELMKAVDYVSHNLA